VVTEGGGGGDGTGHGRERTVRGRYVRYFEEISWASKQGPKPARLCWLTAVMVGFCGLKFVGTGSVCSLLHDAHLGIMTLIGP
jgi:hypothetical protein